MRSASRSALAVLFGASLQLLGCSPDPGPADCAGVERGTAFLDDCNRCGGGTTGNVACVRGCAAVDGGDPAGCVDLNGVTLSTDQRGLPRPVGPRCDVGAFEVQGS